MCTAVLNAGDEPCNGPAFHLGRGKKFQDMSCNVLGHSPQMQAGFTYLFKCTQIKY